MGDLSNFQYYVGTSMVCVIMQFTRACGSTISHTVVQRIVASIKHSKVQLFASHIVALDTNFSYNSSIYTTASISGGIVTCILDEGEGVDNIHIPVAECSDLVTTYNSV